MPGFENRVTAGDLTVTARRGERMCLLGFDMAGPPDPAFAGFAVEVRAPGAAHFEALRNRLAFDYTALPPVDGYRNYNSLDAPFQTYRWVHFPWEPKAGTYTYRVTPRYMRQLDVLTSGQPALIDISLDPVTYADFLDIGFTRNFASSQAFEDRFPNGRDKILPVDGDEGLEWDKAAAPKGVYDWLGFEAHKLLFDMLDQAVADPSITLDVFAYDLNEPDMVAKLEALGPRLRAIIDDSVKKDGTGHGGSTSAESRAAARLAVSAGAANIHRTHFTGLQHNKVLIARRGGKAFQVLAGSTNFTFRGLYIQANNLLIFRSAQVASLFADVFDLAFEKPSSIKADAFSKSWHAVQGPEGMRLQFCFSPHSDSGLSLTPVGSAIDEATSNVFYSFAFMNQTKSGPVRGSLDRLMHRPIFSYGVLNRESGMELVKPDGGRGLVDFATLAKRAPEPFKREWTGQGGINIHHKFVVTDFDLPTAKVFTGSSNHAPSGETGNGDHLIGIEDRRVATAYAIEAIRMFDHLLFRNLLQEQPATPHGVPLAPLALKKPVAFTGAPEAWFDKFYRAGSPRYADRLLFSKPLVP